MSRKEEITEQIRELTRELDGIKKVWPEDGDNYWVAPGDGTIDEQSFVNDGFDKFRRKRGLCFKTKEEATTHRDNDNLYTEIRQALKDANGDWVEDYGDYDQRKYYIRWYKPRDGTIRIDWCTIGSNTKYVAKSDDILYGLVDKYGKLSVCRAFGVIE